MKRVFTYPNNPDSYYIDPDYLGDSTKGLYKRVEELIEGTYKDWEGLDADSDLSRTPEQLMPALSRFIEYMDSEKTGAHLSRYDLWNTPLIRGTMQLIGTQEITSADVDTTAATIVFPEAHGFSDDDQVRLNNFNNSWEFSDDQDYYAVETGNANNLQLRTSETDGPLVRFYGLSSQDINSTDTENSSGGSFVNVDPSFAKYGDIRLTVDDSSVFTSAMPVELKENTTGELDGSLAPFKNQTLYVDIIDSTTIELAENSNLTGKLEVIRDVSQGVNKLDIYLGQRLFNNFRINSLPDPNFANFLEVQISNNKVYNDNVVAIFNPDVTNTNRFQQALHELGPVRLIKKQGFDDIYFVKALQFDDENNPNQIIYASQFFNTPVYKTNPEYTETGAFGLSLGSNKLDSYTAAPGSQYTSNGNDIFRYDLQYEDDVYVHGYGIQTVRRDTNTIVKFDGIDPPKHSSLAIARPRLINMFPTTIDAGGNHTYSTIDPLQGADPQYFQTVFKSSRYDDVTTLNRNHSFYLQGNRLSMTHDDERMYKLHIGGFNLYNPEMKWDFSEPVYSDDGSTILNDPDEDGWGYFVGHDFDLRDGPNGERLFGPVVRGNVNTFNFNPVYKRIYENGIFKGINEAQSVDSTLLGNSLFVDLVNPTGYIFPLNHTTDANSKNSDDVSDFNFKSFEWRKSNSDTNYGSTEYYEWWNNIEYTNLKFRGQPIFKFVKPDTEAFKPAYAPVASPFLSKFPICGYVDTAKTSNIARPDMGGGDYEHGYRREQTGNFTIQGETNSAVNFGTFNSTLDDSVNRPIAQMFYLSHLSRIDDVNTPTFNWDSIYRVVTDGDGKFIYMKFYGVDATDDSLVCVCYTINDDGSVGDEYDMTDWGNTIISLGQYKEWNFVEKDDFAAHEYKFYRDRNYGSDQDHLDYKNRSMYFEPTWWYREQNRWWNNALGDNLPTGFTDREGYLNYHGQGRRSILPEDSTLFQVDKDFFAVKQDIINPVTNAAIGQTLKYSDFVEGIEVGQLNVGMGTVDVGEPFVPTTGGYIDEVKTADDDGQIVLRKPLTGATEGQVALSPTVDAPYEIKNLEIMLPGNRVYSYQDTNNDTQYEALFDETKYWKSGSKIVTPLHEDETFPTISATVDSNGRLSGVSIDADDRGEFRGNATKVFYLKSRDDQYVRPPTDKAAAQDNFDTADHWVETGFERDKKWPETVPPKSVKFTTVSPTQVTTSQSGRKYTRGSGFTRWQLEVEYPPLTESQFLELSAAANAAQGQAIPFVFGLRDRNGNKLAYGNYSKNTDGVTKPRFVGDHSVGDKTFLVDGFESFAKNAFIPGEVVSVDENDNGHINTVLNSVDANVFGEAEFRTSNSAQIAQDSGGLMYKDLNGVVVTLADDSFDYELTQNGLYLLKVTFDLDNFK